MIEARVKKPSVSEIVRGITQDLKVDQKVTKVWDIVERGGTRHIVAEREDFTAERFIVFPGGETEHSLGSIKHRRADRGHPTRLTEFIPEHGEPTELSRKEF